MHSDELSLLIWLVGSSLVLVGGPQDTSSNMVLIFKESLQCLSINMASMVWSRYRAYLKTNTDLIVPASLDSGDSHLISPPWNSAQAQASRYS